MFAAKTDILLIDDDMERRRSLKSLFEKAGKHVLERSFFSLDKTGQSNLLAVIYSQNSKSRHAVEQQLKLINEQYPTIPVILLVAREQHPLIAQQHDWRIIQQLSHPLRFEKVLHLIRECEQAHVVTNREQTKSKPLPKSPVDEISGDSPEIQAVKDLIAQSSRTDVSVLILGESGTGKELVARNIHALSSRRHMAFVAVNCGAIPHDLLESELFGHDKGAFTGAHTRRDGRFKQAQGGTLFLDEIGDMPHAMQVKLLRVLQERVYERVGSNQSQQADVRIITATHQHLLQSIKLGKFREDLYYRLNVFPITVPALRDRSSDLPLLVKDILSHLNSTGAHSVRLASQTLEVLSSYKWPGNIRELSNLLERLSVQFPNQLIDPADLPEPYSSGGQKSIEPGYILPEIPAAHFDLRAHLSELEYNYIIKALEEAGGIVAKAALRLGMGRTTLVEKMRKHRIKRCDSFDADAQ